MSYLDALITYIVPGTFHPRCQMLVVQNLFTSYDSSIVKPIWNPPVTFLAGCNNLSIAPFLFFLYDNNHGQLAAKAVHMHVFIILLE